MYRIMATPNVTMAPVEAGANQSQSTNRLHRRSKQIIGNTPQWRVWNKGCGMNYVDQVDWKKEQLLAGKFQPYIDNSGSGKIPTGRLVFNTVEGHPQRNKLLLTRDRPLSISPHSSLTQLDKCQQTMCTENNTSKKDSGRLGFLSTDGPLSPQVSNEEVPCLVTIILDLHIE